MSRKSVFRVLAVVAALASILVAWRFYLRSVINREIRQLQQAGLPTNGREWNQWYAAVPDRDNAALGLTRAFAQLHDPSGPETNRQAMLKLPSRSGKFTSRQREGIEDWLASNRAALEEASIALKLPGCRFPADGRQLMSLPLPHLAGLRDLGRVHQYMAYLQMEDGRLDEAATNILTILALARTLDAEPILISQLMKLKLINMAATTLNQLLNAGVPGGNAMAELASAFERTRTTGSGITALIGERAMIMPYFQMSQADYEKLQPVGVNESQKDSMLPCKGPFILHLIGYYDLDFGTYLLAMNHGLAAMSNAAPANLKAAAYFNRVGEESGKRDRMMSAVVLKTWVGVPDREAETVAQQLLARAALAVEAFRRKNGRLPDALKDLIPAEVRMEPVDPFTGNSLVYSKRDKGYVIYSVGRDRKDNGGNEPTSVSKLADITFIVER